MVVVGAGRVGTAFAMRAEARSLPVTLVDRERGWEALEDAPGTPILLTVRAEDLRQVVARVPDHRREDLVLCQNGAIRDLITELGLHWITRVVLYVMAPARGEDITAAMRSPVTGRHAWAVASWLEAIGLPAQQMHQLRFGAYELEKLLWLAANGPLCEIHGCTVGEIVRSYREELDQLVTELIPAGRAAWGIDPEPPWVVERCVAWSQTIPDYRASVKEWPFRNGWIRSVAAEWNLQMPMHEELLQQLGHVPR